MKIIIEWASALIMVGSIVYVITNLVMQRIAEKKLEILLVKHKKELNEKITLLISSMKDPHSVHLLEGEIERQAFVNIVREQIDLLNHKDKLILKKTFERKDPNNQWRYTHKLIMDSGLSNFFKLRANKLTDSALSL